MGGIIPDGVLATFNNIEYNRLTSYKNQDTVTLVDGSGSTVVYAGINNQQTGEPTYVGRQNNALVGPTRNNINEYNLVSGTYIATGNTRSITVVNNQAGFAALNVSNPVSPVFTMVVPKNLATKSLVNLQIFAPMNNTAFHWEVLCPEDLPSFTGSPLQADDTCAAADTTYYFARNAQGNTAPFTKDTNTIPEVGNFVFTQSDGSVYANDTSSSQYIIVNNATALEIKNGVCISSAACSNTGGYTSYTSSSVTNFNAICGGGSLPALNQTYYHSGSGVGPGNVYPGQGDVVYSDAAGTTFLQAGYYYLYQDGTGDAHYIQVGLNGVISTASNCTPPTVQFFRSGVQSNCGNFCNANFNISVPTSTTTNDSYFNVVGGETIAGSTIATGWYAYAATSTNTATGTFRIMQIGANNEILGLAECDSGSCTPL